MTTPKIAGVALGGDDSLPLLVVGPALGTGVSTLWSGVASRLAGDLHVIGWNLPGHEGAPMSGDYTLAELAEGVAAFVEDVVSAREDQGPILYAGCGIGGMVGLHLAAHQALPLRGLATVCTPARGEWTESGRSHGAAARAGQPLTWEERAAMVREGGTPAVVTSSASTWFTPAFLERNAAEVVRLLHGLQNTDREGYAVACEAVTDSDLRPLLHRITVPTLVIAGADDEITPVRRAEEVSDGLPRGRLEILRRAAHLAPVEHPRTVAELLLEHLHNAPPEPAGDVTVVTDPDTHPSGVLTRAEIRENGAEVRRKILGDAHVDLATAGVTPLGADFQDYVTRAVWGDIWTRPGLDLRTRTFIALTALVARGHLDELAVHVRGAIRHGLTAAEIAEVILQCAAYCGVPEANAAFATVERVLEEMVKAGEISAAEALMQ